MTEVRKPFWAKCPSCAHCWAAAYLPMEISQCAKLLQKASCQNCGETKHIGIAKQKDGKLNEVVAAGDLPILALSIRQPWAWAIIHGGKDIENRSIGAVRHMHPRTGARAVHASKGMTQDEYQEAREFMRDIGVECPLPAELQRGGIIGSVEVTGAVKESDSRWFFGPRGLVLMNARPCVMVPSVGALGYFKWKPADASIIPPAARWMLPKPAPRDNDLFAGGQA